MLVCNACQRLFYRLIDCHDNSYCVQCSSVVALTTLSPATSIDSQIVDTEYQAVIILEGAPREMGEIMCEALVVQQPVLH